MTTFDARGRGAAAHYKLALLRLHLREQVLTREKTRPADPLLSGVLTDLPMQVAQAAVDAASVDVAAAANADEHASVRQETETAQHQELHRLITPVS